MGIFFIVVAQRPLGYYASLQNFASRPSLHSEFKFSKTMFGKVMFGLLYATIITCWMGCVKQCDVVMPLAMDS